MKLHKPGGLEQKLEPLSILLPLSIVAQVIVDIHRGDTSTRAKVHIQQTDYATRVPA